MRGPAWVEGRSVREQPQWAEHAAFADRLVDEGRILLGGPIDDPDDRVVALIAMEASDVAGVHEGFADDPWVLSGTLALRDVRPWTIWLRAAETA